MVLKLKDQSKLILFDFSGKEDQKELSRMYKVEVGEKGWPDRYNINMEITGTYEDYKEFTEKLDKFFNSYIKK